MSLFIIVFIIVKSSISGDGDIAVKQRVNAAAKIVGCDKPAYQTASVLPLFGKNSKTLVFGCYPQKIEKDSPLGPEIDRVVVMDPKNDCGNTISTYGGDRFLIQSSESAFGKGKNFYNKFFLPAPNEDAPLPRYSGTDKNEIISEPVLQFCNFEDCSVNELFVCHKKRWLHLSRE